MKSIRFRLLIAALAVLLSSAIAKSQTAADAPAPAMHGHHHGYGREGHRMEFFAKYLNLTDEQKAQMKTVLHKEHPAMKPLFQQSRQIEQQLRQYVEGPYDEAKVRALATEKAQVEVELTVAETRVHNELYQLLTPDQQGKMKEFAARHEAGMQKHMQEAPPAPPSE
jgi:Spy/CpxP family protein refolding chaperone